MKVWELRIVGYITLSDKNGKNGIILLPKARKTASIKAYYMTSSVTNSGRMWHVLDELVSDIDLSNLVLAGAEDIVAGIDQNDSQQLQSWLTKYTTHMIKTIGKIKTNRITNKGIYNGMIADNTRVNN
jgi:hypothetical protein